MAEVLALTPLFERLPAPNRKFREVAVVVHNYGGDRKSFKRHFDWLNELGFDVVTFDLPFNQISKMRRGLPLSRDWKFGLRHVWADKISDVLGQILENKILFSFSSPSIAVLQAIAQRHAVDIKGWVCEGGPFTDVGQATLNLLRQPSLMPIQPRIIDTPRVREVFAKATAIFLGLHRYDSDAQKYLRALPKGFPVLSIHGGHDPLVSPDMIDRLFFSALDQLDYERVLAPSSGHLTTLRDEPDLYHQATGDFLKKRATLLG